VRAKGAAGGMAGPTPDLDEVAKGNVPYEDFLAFRALREEQVLARFDELVTQMAERNAEASEEQVAADVDAAGNQLPYMDRLDHTTVADLETITLKTIAGESDFECEALQMPKLGLYKQNEDNGNYDVLFGALHLITGTAFLNLCYADETWRKVVHDLRFRQALDMAVDREELIDAVLYGMAELDPRHPPYDPEGAKKLLDEIGMDKMGPDGFRLAPDGNPFVIDFESQDIYGAGPATELYVQFWNAVGINATMQLPDAKLLRERRNANELKAAVNFTTSPMWYYQDYGQSWWCRIWWQWWTTSGAQGEEPPGEIKEIFSSIEGLLEVPVEEAFDLAEQLETTIAEKVYYSAPAYRVQQVFIANRNLGNIIRNEKAFALATEFSLEGVFYKA
jgi:peptide/nickel transport system substrate-binding protein